MKIQPGRLNSQRKAYKKELEMLEILKHFSVVYGRPIKRLWKPKNLDLLDTHANDLNSDNK